MKSGGIPPHILNFKTGWRLIINWTFAVTVKVTVFKNVMDITKD